VTCPANSPQPPATRWRAVLSLCAGDSFLISPRPPHNARDLGRGTRRMLSSYITEAGQPLVSLTGEPNY
jgi:hypothetical protein